MTGDNAGERSTGEKMCSWETKNLKRVVVKKLLTVWEADRKKTQKRLKNMENLPENFFGGCNLPPEAATMNPTSHMIEFCSDTMLNLGFVCLNQTTLTSIYNSIQNKYNKC